jgi:hypothetical protein
MFTAVAETDNVININGTGCMILHKFFRAATVEAAYDA